MKKNILAFLHEDIGGYENLIEKYFNATATIRASVEPNGTEFCGEVPADAMHLLRSSVPGVVWTKIHCIKSETRIFTLLTI